MEEQTQYSENPAGNSKIIAIISYITLIGWIVAVVMNSNEKKNELSTFHIRQSFGLMVVSFAIAVLQMILLFIPFIGWGISIILNLVYIAVFVFWIMGLISAIKEETTPVPWIGSYFQKWFNFLQ